MSRRRIWQWIAGVIGVPIILAISTATWVYLASEKHLRSFPKPPPFALTIPQGAAAIERGAHLTRTRGCYGCHGKDLAGEIMWETAVAPNLPALAQNESAATLEAAMRHAIGRDGRALYSMPSYNFVRLRDEDIADIIAFLRNQPVTEKDLPSAQLPWIIRFEIARGRDAAIPAYLELVPPLRLDSAEDPALARGEYIAMTTCNECHGFSLRADTPWGDSAPDLIIVSAYDEQAFRSFMKTGIALGGRELPMMSAVARSRFAWFTDQEVSDLHAFLREMAARAMAE
jgi:cytochrome c553